jgi:hypothetical protein
MRLIGVMALTIGGSLGFAGAAESQLAVELTDPAGDVREPAGEANKDLVKLSLTSDGKQLLIVATFKDDLARSLAGKSAGNVIRVYVDTDNKPATGGKATWSDKSGFEYVVEVRACIKYDSGEACQGALTGPKMTSLFSRWVVKKHSPPGDNFNATHDLMWDSPSAVVSGKVVQAAIPYAEIGAQTGQALRLVVREEDGPFDGSALLPDATLKLK